MSIAAFTPNLHIQSQDSNNVFQKYYKIRYCRSQHDSVLFKTVAISSKCTNRITKEAQAYYTGLIFMQERGTVVDFIGEKDVCGIDLFEIGDTVMVDSFDYKVFIQFSTDRVIIETTNMKKGSGCVITKGYEDLFIKEFYLPDLLDRKLKKN